MNSARRQALFSVILWAVIALAVGAIIGELHGRRMGKYTYAQNLVYEVIPECVQEYDGLAHGETNKVARMCGERLWSFLYSYDKEFAGGTLPKWFPKWLPEARRIVSVVSNEDRQAMTVTNPQEAAFLKQLYNTNLPGIDSVK
jgi:hypothetical protein